MMAVLDIHHLHSFDRAETLLGELVKQAGSSVVLASSLGVEDQVLTHMLCQLTPTPHIFVLDTGRLHQETYDVMQLTMASYGFNYEVFFPESSQVEAMVQEKGPNLFYDSVENRQQCCGVRKVAPLKRALANRKAWITGLRKEQAVTRSGLEMVSWDDVHQLVKVNPLLHWTTEDVWNYVKAHDVPVNTLHHQGYPSIGCSPCTRAIKPGEDLRAGRWWWENPESKECGLHVKS